MPVDAPAPAPLYSLAALLRHLDFDGMSVPRLKFEVALTHEYYPFNPLPYLESRGHRIGSFDDLLAINDDLDEEETRCIPVAEGMLVTLARNWLWVLLER